MQSVNLCHFLLRTRSCEMSYYKILRNSHQLLCKTYLCRRHSKLTEELLHRNDDNCIEALENGGAVEQ